jgi:putative ABC transport system permease protein
MDALRQDLRFAARSLRRRPLFAGVAILTIAISIGAATAIYGAVDAVLFRSLPYRDAGRIFAVWQTIPSWRKEPILAYMWDRVVVSYPDFENWRDKQASFSAVGAWTTRSVMVTTDDRPEQITTTRSSPSLFDVLGIKALVGRTLLPGEDVLNGPHVTLVSYDAWQSRFGGRRDVVGSTVRFDSIPFTIVGVLPRDFALVRGQTPTPFFVPAGQDSDDTRRDNHNFHAIARLKPGVSVDRAAAEANVLLGGPESKRGIRVLEYQLDQTRDVRGPLLLLLGAVAMLLLVASANVATLLLGEAATRDHEIAARVALGATRARLVRQLFTESMLLAGVGALVGVGLAWGMTKVLIAIAPTRIPSMQLARVDGRVLGVAVIVALVTGALFGLAPAMTLSRAGPAALLRSSGQSARGRASLQRLMIAAELALSVVLLVGAGLVSRSLEKLTAVDPGFRSDHLLSVRLAIPRSAHLDDAAVVTQYAAIFDRLGALPGVVAVTGGSPTPFDGNSSSSTMQKEGDDEVTDRPRREAQQRVVVPNFFDALGIPVLAGRAFTSDDRDGAPLVAIVSEALARRDWPGESPIGRRVRYQGALRTVVGIAGDTKTNSLSKENLATIYTPFAQRSQRLTLMIRTRGDPAALVPAIRNALHAAAPLLPMTGADVVQDRIRQSFAEERFRTILIDSFGVIAALLSAIGMFGVTARAVARRTREIGIRVALGASSASVLRMIVGHTLTAVSVGVVVGLGASVATGRLLEPYMFGVSARDPITYALIIGLLAAVSVVASWIPARRAGRVQPAVVLRGD